MGQGSIGSGVPLFLCLFQYFLPPDYSFLHSGQLRRGCGYEEMGWSHKESIVRHRVAVQSRHVGILQVYRFHDRERQCTAQYKLYTEKYPVATWHQFFHFPAISVRSGYVQEQRQIAEILRLL